MPPGPRSVITHERAGPDPDEGVPPDDALCRQHGGEHDDHRDQHLHEDHDVVPSDRQLLTT
ncbi:hypothetical protein Cus16_0957 [Curtobacterium sp. ER1/6]|nr:hypothetical protein Cus16_0957 [Curtobacterium sp. ER1/6]